MATVSESNAAAGVHLLQWPRDTERRRELARLGSPRILIIPAGVLPPVVDRVLEDWIRSPAAERDLFVRMRRLASAQSTASHATDRTLFAGDTRLGLSPRQAELMNVLLREQGRVVAKQQLLNVLWPSGNEHDRALVALIGRTRRKIAATGWTIASVRSRGYVLIELAST